MIENVERLSVQSFISTRHPFEIPKYQRGYAWEKEEVEDFCKDIQSLTPAGGVAEHFFGGVLTSKFAVPGAERQYTHEIIDGQQRLSTFFLALSCMTKALVDIRAEATASGDTALSNTADELMKMWDENYIQYKELAGGGVVRYLRLKMSKVDRGFFEELIHNRVASRPDATKPSSHIRLFEAKRRIWKLLFQEFMEDAALTTLQKLEVLKRIKAAALEKCVLIHVQSTSRKDGYSLFKVLNDRGRDLSDAEKLRASSLELLEMFPMDQEHVEACWDTILGKKPEIVERFLKAYFPSKVGERAGRDLFRAYTEKFLPYEKAAEVDAAKATTIRQLIDEIRTELECFTLLEDGKWPYSPASSSLWHQVRLDRLVNTLRHSLCLPLLLSAAKYLNEAQFAELILFLERLCFRHITIEGAHAGRLAEKYYAHAMKIRAEGGSFSLSACYSDLLSLSSMAASTFKSRLSEELVYKQRNNTDRRKDILYFLTTVEDFFDWFNRGAVGTPTPNSTTVVTDIDNLQVEHIYPQTPQPGHVDTALEPVKHHLGNLTYFTDADNRCASNEPFAVKQPTFASSGVKLNIKLASEAAWCPWTAAAVQQRQEDLLLRALKIFMF
jgi:hypothetical protein